MAGERILIVEDEAIVAKDVEQSLIKLGYQVTGIARYGTEAVGLVAKSQPDLVLMDISLEGDKDGVKTAEVIGSRFGTPVVYVTAHTDQATVARARHTKPVGYLVKPLNYERLRATVEKALASRKSGGITLTGGRKRPAVLLIDDAAARQVAILRAMGKQYLVKVAPSFSQGTKMLNEGEFDLFVANIDLRDALRGEALRQLRRRHGVTTPAVVIGTDLGDSAVQLLKDEGVQAFLEMQDDIGEKLRVELDRLTGGEAES